MNLIKILDTDDWVVEYDAENNQYRVSYFQDYHFVDDVLFDGGEWIPVSEMLPKDEQVVMVCKNDDICIRRYRYDVNLKRGFWHELSDDWGWSEKWVDAWTPLPEPYKESKR